MNDWINLALKTAEKAGEIIISYYKSNYEIQNKSYHNPVTTADYHANDYIKKHSNLLIRTLDGFPKKQKTHQIGWKKNLYGLSIHLTEQRNLSKESQILL